MVSTACWAAAAACLAWVACGMAKGAGTGTRAGTARGGRKDPVVVAVYTALRAQRDATGAYSTDAGRAVTTQGIIYLEGAIYGTAVGASAGGRPRCRRRAVATEQGEEAPRVGSASRTEDSLGRYAMTGEGVEPPAQVILDAVLEAVVVFRVAATE